MPEISENQPGVVLVDGDFVIDNHVYEGRRHDYADPNNIGVHVEAQTGGAGLVYSILAEEAFRELPENFAGAEADSNSDKAKGSAESKESTKPKEPPNDGDSTSPKLGSEFVFQAVTRPANVPNSQQAYAFWRPHVDAEDEKTSWWRVSEAMGFGAEPTYESNEGTPTGRAAPQTANGDEERTGWPPTPGLPVAPHVVVISEGGMNYRDFDSGRWPTTAFESAKWIVLKTAAPLCEGPLWDFLVHQDSDFRDKLVIVVSASDLRRAEVSISSGLTWESTLGDIVQAVKPGQPDDGLSKLARCQHLFIMLESEGALWIDLSVDRSDPRTWVMTFVGEADSIEGARSHNTKGRSFGALSCLTAALANKLARAPEKLKRNDGIAGMEGGLAAAADLCLKGHGIASEPARGFPTARIAEVIKRPGRRYTQAKIPASPGDDWSVIRSMQAIGVPAHELGRAVLLRGPVALKSVPHLKVGHLIATDRQEIETLRTIETLIRYYDERDKGKMPLSIGVFGPPGSGKSFAVEQICKQLVDKDQWLEFNLSQFSSEQDLIGAFHQVRDRVLQKKLPVAFFDEFDSQSYRWLQYLLAPMQDGRFQEGQLTHTIGKCIFVFAGATSYTYGTFGPRERSASDDEKDFRLKKGPDFKSRLDCYLDVTGPNPRYRLLDEDDATQDDAQAVGDYRFVFGTDDACFPIRRALMIRNKLDCADDECLAIDEGLVRALLSVKKLNHGARSLDKILQPLRVVRPEKLRRSHLPPDTQLTMQTNAREFRAEVLKGRPNLAYGDALNDFASELGPWIHQYYADDNDKTDDRSRRENVPYDRLTDVAMGLGPEEGGFFQRSNVEAARRIPAILDLAGLRVENADDRWGDAQMLEIRLHLESYLEVLAAEEHRLWMAWHLAQGFKHGKVDRDKRFATKRHPCLLPYEKLPQWERDKDRTSVRKFPDKVVKANKKIVRVDPW